MLDDFENTKVRMLRSMLSCYLLIASYLDAYKLFQSHLNRLYVRKHDIKSPNVAISAEMNDGANSLPKAHAHNIGSVMDGHGRIMVRIDIMLETATNDHGVSMRLSFPSAIERLSADATITQPASRPTVTSTVNQ